MKTINEIRNTIDNTKTRSAWSAGVKTYADEILDNLAAAEAEHRINMTIATRHDLKAAALCGADDWDAYSWGGCSLIYNSDIAATLCSPSELKRTRNGERRPNSRENWLDVQVRALHQAFIMVCSAAE